MLAETVGSYSDSGELIGGYLARPLDEGAFPGVIVIHEEPGLIEHIREVTRKLAAHGCIALAPNLYYREAPEITEEARAAIRANGGIPDDRAVKDLEGAARTLRATPKFNGKIGCIGFGCGGRHALLFASHSTQLAAAVDCYGGQIFTDELTPNSPKAVIDVIPHLNCHLLGLFGAADDNPSPADVKRLEEELRAHGKKYEFHTYPGDVGHGFFADYRTSYRQEAAVDGWTRIFDFFDRHLR
jgi:carboxymethylenebutenolidase